MAFQSKPHHFSRGKKTSAPAGDDRNLVLVDDDFQDADFEDRVWLFWQRHGVKTVVSAVAVFVAIIAFIVWREVEKNSVESIQAEYSAATTPEAKLAFAENNADEPLAGAAYFAVGGEFAEAGKYAEAASAFEGAARVFGALDGFSAMRDRAIIAQASALSHAETPESVAAANALLKKIAAAPAAEPLYRGQAMYELAASALVAGDLATARLWIDEMDRSLAPTNYWRSRKNLLISFEPNLAAPQAAPAVQAAPEAAPAES